MGFRSGRAASPRAPSWASAAMWALAVLAMIVHGVGAQTAGICDPVVPDNCLLPFPNNFYSQPDATTPTGRRVVYPQAAFPVDREGVSFPPDVWSRLDGFSVTTAAIAYFANLSLAESRVPGWQDMARSLDDDCPTILLDAVTGERLAHFAELDFSTERTDQRAFLLWPSKQLRFNRRYIVAMRGLVDGDGTALASSDAFRAFRDGIPTSDPDIEGRRDIYADIFAQLERAGVPRASLQLAWEFSTASLDWTTGWLVSMRDDATARLPEGGPDYEIVSVTDDVSDNIFRVIEGTMTVPHYMTNDALPGSVLVIGADNTPVYQGNATVPFTVHIPRSCLDRACPIVNYCHGMLGSREEAGYGAQSGVANTYGYIMVAVDMWGMSQYDAPFLWLALRGDLSDFVTIPDRTHQGVLNHLVVMKLMRGAFVNDPNVVFDGSSVLDPARVHLWGISQGGVLGTVVVAVSQDIERAHIGVPGNPFPLLMTRAINFDRFYAVIRARFLDSFDRIVIQSLAGQLWDRAEGSGYMGSMSGENRLPGISFDKYLYVDYSLGAIDSCSLGDSQVNYLATYMLGRSLNAKVFANNVACANETTPIFGFEVTDSPTIGGITVMVGFDFGVPCGPVTNQPPPAETDTHDLSRRDVRNQDMAFQFLATGIVTDRCDGLGCGPLGK